MECRRTRGRRTASAARSRSTSAPTTPTAVRRRRGLPDRPRGPLTIESVRSHQGRLLVASPGIDDRTSAEAMRGVLLVADARRRTPDDPDEFYDHELVGLRRRTPAGAASATVTEVLHHPVHDLLVVRGRDGGSPGAVRGRDRPRVDVARRRRRRRPAAGPARGRLRPPTGRLDRRTSDRRRMRVHARRRHHDLPRLPRPARALAGRQGAEATACSTCASTTCATGHRPAPLGRRHAVRRRRRHGDAARAVGPGARGGLGGREARAASPARRPDPGRPAVHPGGGRASSRPSRGWSSPAAGTRASTSGWSRTRGDRLRVDEISLGDYVLAGGEVAALVMVEAVTRLLPGVLGNPESLVEESHVEAAARVPRLHEAGAAGAAATCPTVLLSGHHAEIARWRRVRRCRRTAARRPDLLARARRGCGTRRRRRWPRSPRWRPTAGPGVISPLRTPCGRLDARHPDSCDPACRAPATGEALGRSPVAAHDARHPTVDRG